MEVIPVRENLRLQTALTAAFHLFDLYDITEKGCTQYGHLWCPALSVSRGVKWLSDSV